MNIEDLTIKQIKEIQSLFLFDKSKEDVAEPLINEYVLIRTYSAGVWAGYLEKKVGNEIILKNARRLWRLFCQKSISLSAVARYGIIDKKSKIAPEVSQVWLQPIEIILVHEDAIESIKDATIVEQE